MTTAILIHNILINVFQYRQVPALGPRGPGEPWGPGRPGGPCTPGGPTGPCHNQSINQSSDRYTHRYTYLDEQKNRQRVTQNDYASFMTYDHNIILHHTQKNTEITLLLQMQGKL